MSKAFSITASKEGKVAKLVISGFISEVENRGVDIVAAIDKALETADSVEVRLVNVYGGSVMEGMPAATHIKSLGNKVVTVAEGIVASMGSILFLAGAKRKVVKRSRLMLHKVGVSASGDSTKLREVADLADSMEADLVEMIAEATGQSVDAVKAEYMVSGKDTYLTAQQCLEKGIAHKILDGNINEPTNNASTLEDMVAHYDNLIINHYTPQDMDKLPYVTAALGLPDNATEKEVVKFVNELKAKADAADARAVTAEAKVEAAEKVAKEATVAKVTNLVKGAVEAGKILPADEAKYTKLANADYDTTAEILNGMKGRGGSLTDQIKNGGASGSKAWYEGKTWAELHKEGKLLKLQNEAPDVFADLKKEWLESQKA